MRLPTHRSRTQPGEILLEEWLKPMKLTQLGLAKKMGVDTRSISGHLTERMQHHYSTVNTDEQRHGTPRSSS